MASCLINLPSRASQILANPAGLWATATVGTNCDIDKIGIQIESDRMVRPIGAEDPSARVGLLEIDRPRAGDDDPAVTALVEGRSAGER